MITQDEMFWLADRVLRRAKDNMRRKTHDYGSTAWQTLGLKGTFADIHKKYWRLRHLIWENGKPLVAESIADSMRDMLGYALLGMIQLEYMEGGLREFYKKPKRKRK